MRFMVQTPFHSFKFLMLARVHLSADREAWSGRSRAHPKEGRKDDVAYRAVQRVTKYPNAPRAQLDNLSINSFPSEIGRRLRHLPSACRVCFESMRGTSSLHPNGWINLSKL